MCLHFLYLVGGKAVPSPGKVLGVQEKGKGITILLQNGECIGIDTFPAIVQGNERAAGRQGSGTQSPLQKLLHTDDRNTGAAKIFHLFAKFRRAHEHLRNRCRLAEIVVPQHGNTSLVPGDIQNLLLFYNHWGNFLCVVLLLRSRYRSGRHRNRLCLNRIQGKRVKIHRQGVKLLGMGHHTHGQQESTEQSFHAT